jgi:hypothetical protein
MNSLNQRACMHCHVQLIQHFAVFAQTMHNGLVGLPIDSLITTCCTKVEQGEGHFLFQCGKKWKGLQKYRIQWQAQRPDSLDIYAQENKRCLVYTNLGPLIWLALMDDVKGISTFFRKFFCFRDFHHICLSGLTCFMANIINLIPYKKRIQYHACQCAVISLLFVFLSIWTS